MTEEAIEKLMGTIIEVVDATLQERQFSDGSFFTTTADRDGDAAFNIPMGPNHSVTLWAARPMKKDWGTDTHGMSTRLPDCISLDIFFDAYRRPEYSLQIRTQEEALALVSDFVLRVRAELSIRTQE